jgi:hypothetical protein
VAGIRSIEAGGKPVLAVTQTQAISRVVSSYLMSIIKDKAMEQWFHGFVFYDWFLVYL